MSLRLTRWARVTLDAFKLFDAQVDEHRVPLQSGLRGEPASGVADVHFHPAEKRSVRFSAAFSY